MASPPTSTAATTVMPTAAPTADAPGCDDHAKGHERGPKQAVRAGGRKRQAAKSEE